MAAHGVAVEKAAANFASFRGEVIVFHGTERRQC